MEAYKGKLKASMIRIFVLLMCFLLSACLVGPNFKEPIKKVASHWLRDEKSIKEGRSENANWWKVFQDPNLIALIYLGYHSNLSLQSTAVHVLQMRAQLAQSVGELYPQQQALMGNLTYNRIGGSQFQSLLPSSFTTALMGFTASWELDFWGKYRRAILSNDAIFLASFAAYDHALVTLTSDIATAYISIRTTQQLMRITQQNIQVQQTGLDIAKARFSAGQASLLDVEQAQTELSQTEANMPVLRAKLQQQKDTLGLLLGTTPNQVDKVLLKKYGIPRAPLSVAVGIPVETLAKRPDIYQARMEAIAQSEAIGAVKATLFPSISLSGTFAFAANNINGNKLSSLFNWSNHTVSAGPGFTWPLLNYGQITNRVREQDAVFQQALLNYMNLVLQAQKEVQDNMTRFVESRKTELILIKASTSAVKATQLALIRYREGESDYTPVLNALRQQLQVQNLLTQAKGEIPAALVALYRALGGGWQIRNREDIIPKPIKEQMGKRTDWGTLLKQENHQPPATEGQQLKQTLVPNW